MGDACRERLDGGSFGGIDAHYCGALEGGDADFVDAVGGNVWDEADVDGVVDVDVVGGATEFDDVFEFLVVDLDVGVGCHGAILLAGMAAGIPPVLCLGGWLWQR